MLWYSKEVDGRTGLVIPDTSL